MTDEQKHDVELYVTLIRNRLDAIYAQVYDDTCDEDQGITLTAIGNAISLDSLSYWCKEKRERIMSSIEQAHDTLDEILGVLQ